MSVDILKDRSNHLLESQNTTFLRLFRAGGGTAPQPADYKTDFLCLNIKYQYLFLSYT